MQGEAYDEMNVSRPHRMSIQQLQQLSSRAIVRNRITSRPQTIKIIFPILPRREPPPQIEIHLVFILLLIQSIRCRMPHIQLGPLDRLARQIIRYRPVHQRVVAILNAMHGRSSHLTPGRIFTPEGAENGARGRGGGGGGGKFEGYFINE